MPAVQVHIGWQHPERDSQRHNLQDLVSPPRVVEPVKTARSATRRLNLDQDLGCGTDDIDQGAELATTFTLLACTTLFSLWDGKFIAW